LFKNKGTGVMGVRIEDGMLEIKTERGTERVFKNLKCIRTQGV
jgi:hypothetical protein